MAERDITSLYDAGLTLGESKVYLALLELGPNTTGPIIEQSGVAKSIVYQLLEKLIQKGLVSYVIKSKTKHYQAADPHKLVDYIKRKELQLKKNKEKVENLIPSLLLMQESAEESEVKVFKGFEGLITVHEHTYQKLKPGEEYYYFGITPEQPKHFHSYWQKDHKRRMKAGIQCKLLFHPSTQDSILKNRNSFKGCDARYMSKSINAPSWFFGYKDVVVLSLASSKPLTIEIVNQEIANSFKSYFQEFWNKTKPFRR